jgi:hypothetical protein
MNVMSASITLIRRMGFSVFILAFFPFLIYPSPVKQKASLSYDVAKALKVIRIVQRMQEKQVLEKPGVTETVAVTEDELNAYIAHRIDVEQEDVMKELVLKLNRDNRLEGKVGIDLQGQKLPSFIRPKMTLFFEGRMEIRNGRIRLNLSHLFLENQKVQPAVLDFIIFISARIQGEEPASLNDWFDLPFGIRDIRTEKGRAIFTF